MKKVFIIHGFQGEPNGSWKSWLMWELAKAKIYACALPMPRPDEPKKSEWIKMISDFTDTEKDEVYLVGHSLGCIAIMRYLESLQEKISVNGVVLVAGPCKIINAEDKDSKLRLIDHFLDTPINFEYINQKAKKFVVIHGDDDPNVPFEHAQIISKGLDCELVTIKGGGHLGAKAGFWELPEALEALNGMFKLVQ